jgi:hypothetical protein
MDLSQDVCFIELYLLDYDVACIFSILYYQEQDKRKCRTQRYPYFCCCRCRTHTGLFSFCAGDSLGLEDMSVIY